MFKKITIASIAACISLSSQATETSNNFYIKANSGVSFGQTPNGDFQEGTLDKSVIYGMAFGYKIHEDVSVDLSLDYRPGFKNNYQTSNAVSYDGGSVMTSDIKVKSLTSMLNFNYNLAKLGDLTTYFTAGLGASQNKTNEATETRVYKDGFIQTETYSKGKKIDFAWKAGLGAKYSLNKNFDIDLHYQYVDLGKFVTGKTSSIDGGNYESIPVESGSIRSHEVLFGVAFKF